MFKDKQLIKSFIMASFLVLPQLFWLFFDRGFWGIDSCGLAINTVTLYYFFLQSPELWWQQLWRVSAITHPHTPLLCWLGQWLVPIGEKVGNIDIVLSGLVLFFAVATLSLFYNTLIKVCQDKALAFLGVLCLGSAPLFVGLSMQYYVEMLQVFSVVWFLYIMVQVNHWTIQKTIIQLVYAISFSLLTKASAPLYVFVPGIYILITILLKILKNKTVVFSGRHVSLAFAGAMLCGLVSVVWIIKNAPIVWAYTSVSAQFFGEKLSWSNKLFYWMQILQLVCFDFPILAKIVFGTTLVGAVFLREKKEIVWAGICFVQVVMIICISSLMVNQDPKYVLALFPYVILLWCLSLVKIKNNRLIWLFLLVLTIQYVGVQARFWGLSTWAAFDWQSRPIQWQQENIEKLQKLIEIQKTLPSGQIVLGGRYKRMHLRLIQYELIKQTRQPVLKNSYTDVFFMQNFMYNPSLVHMYDRVCRLKPVVYIGFPNEYLSIIEKFRGNNQYKQYKIDNDIFVFLEKTKKL